MRVFFTLLLVFNFIYGGLANAQHKHDVVDKSSLITKGSNSILEGKITSSSTWLNGTQILEFTMTYNSMGSYEYMDGLKMEFPEGMVPNATGTSNPLTTPGGCSGSHLNLNVMGQTLFWGVDTSSLCGAYYGGTFNFQVSDTNTGLVGDQIINYIVYGDGLGEEPHIVNGSVIIPETEAHDLGVVDIAPKLLRSGSTVVPRVTVENLGANNENTWSLTLTDGEVYTSTVSGINILVGETKVIEMDSWTPDEGNHVLKAVLTLEGDINAINDVLTQTVSVGNFTIAFAWNAIHNFGVGATGKGPINISLETGIMGQIAINNSDKVIALDYVGNEIYGIYYVFEENNYLVKIDPTTGVVTHIGGGAPNLSGFAYDITTETAYVIDYYGMLSTIDLETGELTNIGGNYVKVLSLACDANGNLFAISSDDHLASIDKTTGAFTIVGNLGVDINYAQDIAFDRDNNILYGALFVNARGRICTINTTNGVASLIVEVFDHITGLAIPYGNNNSIPASSCTHVFVYPNPSNGLVNVQVSEKSVITVVDIAGRVVATYNANANETLSFTQAAGVYVVKVESNGQVSNHKLVIQ